MKVVVAREVERFLFRPGLQERARYYGVIFLNQMPLSHAASQGTAHLASCPMGNQTFPRDLLDMHFLEHIACDNKNQY